MASINDVYNELVAVNSLLNQIHADGVAEVNATNQVRASVDTVAQINVAEVNLLFHLTQQTDTMICSLEQIAQNTCAILNQVTIQTRFQERMRDDLDTLRAIAETAYPGAALERHRFEVLQAEIERCCPPEQPEPACTYEPCPRPRPIKMPQLPPIGDTPAPVG